MINVTEGYDIERIGLIITLKCNLKCKLCVQHCPYYEKPYSPDIDEIYKTIDEIFRLNLKINHFVISGGEPLLRKDLCDITDYLYPYRNNFASLEIITNGSVETEKFLPGLKKWGKQLYFIIDNYGDNLSRKIGNISKALNTAEIRYKINDYSKVLHCDGWVDFGDFSERTARDYAETLFVKCNYAQSYRLALEVVNGVIDPCLRSRLCREKSLPIPKGDYVDLFDSSKSTEAKAEKIKSWYGLGFLHACKYCDGMCDDSKRYMPAEQIKRSTNE